MLGGARYGSVVKATLPAGWWAGAFSGTFTDARPFIEELVATGRPKGIRIQLLWDDHHAFSAATVQQAALEARKWKAIVERYPVRWAFSGACEHHLPPAIGVQMQLAVLNELPGVTYVNVGPNIPSTASVWNEIHGTGPAPQGIFSYSFDGTDCVNANVSERRHAMQSAQVFFFWTSNFNGRKTDKDPTPRPQRKAWPTIEMMQSVIALSGERGATGLVPGATWKTHAEQYADVPQPAQRDNKPVLILPSNASSAALQLANGKALATARRFGAGPSTGTSRYYFTQWGYQLADLARAAQGSPVVTVIAGNKSFGRLNPAFREGTYR